MGWYAHAFVYLVVNAVLAALSLSMGRQWAIFPALGWGLGLLVHGVSVFLLAGGSDLHARMVQAERNRIVAQDRRS